MHHYASTGGSVHCLKLHLGQVELLMLRVDNIAELERPGSLGTNIARISRTILDVTEVPKAVCRLCIFRASLNLRIYSSFCGLRTHET